MNRPPNPALQRALDLSRDLLTAARQGDMPRVVDLDAQRGRLLREFLDGLRQIGATERGVLDEIQALNEQGLSCIEQRRRDTAEEFAQLGRGRRAADAYASVQER